EPYPKITEPCPKPNRYKIKQQKRLFVAGKIIHVSQASGDDEANGYKCRPRRRQAITPPQSSHVQGRCNQSVCCNIRQRSHYSIEPDLAKTFTYSRDGLCVTKDSARGLRLRAAC